ncbi:hypothetical protein GCM10023192_34710 [Amycolatopsis samaneae]
MIRRRTTLHTLLAGVGEWDDMLLSAAEAWLMTRCTRDQLIKIADRSGRHEIAPAYSADPVKAVLASDLVERLTPSELLNAWQQVMHEETESEAAFDRVLERAPRRHDRTS